MRSSTFKIESSKIHSFRNPKYAIRNSAGFAYIALLVAIIIIGISLTAAGKYWSNVSLRDKEEELLFRGDQYRQAIERYYLYLGRRQYPPSIDDLVKDSRSAVGMHHLRQKFKEPITGDDFVEIKDPYQRIIGVRSSSDKLSIKQANFPINMLISSQPSVTNLSQIPVQTNVPNATQVSNQSDQTDGSDISSAGTPTIKYSDWLFVSTIKAAPTTTTLRRPIVPGQSPIVPLQTPVPGQPFVPGQSPVPGQPFVPGRPFVPGQSPVPGQPPAPGQLQAP